MKRYRDPNEIRAKAYCLNPDLLQAFKEEILTKYSKSSVSRILGPDNESSYWVFINIYKESN